MSTPNVLAAGVYHFGEPGSLNAPENNPDLTLADATNRAIGGGRKLIEANEVAAGIEGLEEARLIVAGLQVMPDVRFTFASHAVGTLTAYGVRQMSTGVTREEIGITTTDILPHAEAGRIAIEASLDYGIGLTPAIQANVHNAVAATLLDGTGRASAWLRRAREAATRTASAEGRTPELEAALHHLTTAKQLSRRLSGRETPAFNSAQAAAGFALGCLVEAPSLEGYTKN